VSNQLTGAGNNNYSYDTNGNRTMSGYQTGTDNQLTSDGNWNSQYDPTGNQIEKDGVAGGPAALEGIVQTIVADGRPILWPAASSQDHASTDGASRSVVRGLRHVHFVERSGAPRGASPDPLSQTLEELCADYERGARDGDGHQHIVHPRALAVPGIDAKRHAERHGQRHSGEG